MSELSSAEEHLRVIRTLMERSTVYRAISAPAALIAGTLAAIAGFIGAHRGDRDQEIIALWSSVLTAAMAVNFWFLYRDSSQRQAPFFSSGMRMALQAMAPPLTVGLVGTWALRFAPDALPLLWMITYGLALLSTSHFAPRSLSWLGWIFVASSMISIRPDLINLGPNLLMAATFGLFHIVYGLAAWPRRS